jgi:hypothetical protein
LRINDEKQDAQERKGFTPALRSEQSHITGEKGMRPPSSGLELEKGDFDNPLAETHDKSARVPNDARAKEQGD